MKNSKHSILCFTRLTGIQQTRKCLLISGSILLLAICFIDQVDVINLDITSIKINNEKPDKNDFLIAGLSSAIQEYSNYEYSYTDETISYSESTKNTEYSTIDCFSDIATIAREYRIPINDNAYEDYRSLLELIQKIKLIENIALKIFKDSSKETTSEETNILAKNLNETKFNNQIYDINILIESVKFYSQELELIIKGYAKSIKLNPKSETIIKITTQEKYPEINENEKLSNINTIFYDQNYLKAKIRIWSLTKMLDFHIAQDIINNNKMELKKIFKQNRSLFNKINTTVSYPKLTVKYPKHYFIILTLSLVTLYFCLLFIALTIYEISYRTKGDILKDNSNDLISFNYNRRLTIENFILFIEYILPISIGFFSIALASIYSFID